MIALQRKNNIIICETAHQAKERAVYGDTIIINDKSATYPQYDRISELTQYTASRKCKDKSYWTSLAELKRLVNNALIWEMI